MKALNFGPRTLPPQGEYRSSLPVSAVGSASYLVPCCFVVLDPVVFGVNLCEGDDGTHLAMDQMSQPVLPLEEAWGKPCLTSQGRQKPASCVASGSCVTEWCLFPWGRKSFIPTQDSSLLVGPSLYWQPPSQSRQTVDLLPSVLYLSAIWHTWVVIWQGREPRGTV